MARTITAPYRVEMTVPGYYYTPQAWQTKYAGKPTAENLTKDIARFEASTQPGGCNAHLGPQVVTYARIIRQSTGRVVAEYVRAAAEVAA